MKNENGIERSAILKGSTLVNLCNVKNDVTFQSAYNGNTANRMTRFMSLQNTILQPNTKYLVRFKITNYINESNLTIPLTSNDYHISSNTININGNGYYNIIATTMSDMSNYGGMLVVKGGATAFENNTTSNVSFMISEKMVIEYQQGMENWDIPYFEGMQSVETPILTTTGKNLFNGELEKGLIDGITGELSNNNNFVRSVDYIKVEPNINYSILEKDNLTSFRVYEYDNNFNYISYTANNNFTTSSSTKYIKFRTYPTKDGDDDVSSLDFKIMVYEGQTTPYEPYQYNTLTVNEPIELRGIGNVQDELNLATGEVTERIKKFDFLATDDGNWYYHKNENGYTSYYMSNQALTYKKLGICDKLPICSWTGDAENMNKECVWFNGATTWGVMIKSDKASTKQDFLNYLNDNVELLLISKTETIKTVDLNIVDQNNQPQERMKLFPNGYINTSSSTFPPILELKGITHNNKLNMTTTNGTNNTQLTILDNLALDGIICNNGTVVRDSYDVESGLYTKRVFRATIDEEFINNYTWNITLPTNYQVVQYSRANPLPKSYNAYSVIGNNLITAYAPDMTSVELATNNNIYIRIRKEELTSYDINGLLDWIKRNGAIEVAYEMSTPQIIHMQPNMTPYVSTRPYQGSIESQGNILESSYLDYTSEQSIISPKPLGDGDVLKWEQGSQCYVYENDKEYIPLTDYNQPIGTVLDLEEEDGEQFVENLDGGDIIVDVPFKEKAVYERHLVPYEDKVIYPTQDKLDPTGKIEVDYICGATWQNPNDLSDIRHVGTLREDGQYDVTIRRSGDDEIRLMDGITHLSLDRDGLNPSEFELTFFNSGGVEVGKYGDTTHMLEDCVLDSKLETGTVYGDTLVNVLDTTQFSTKTVDYTIRTDDGYITLKGRDDYDYVYAYHKYQGNLKPDTQYTLIIDFMELATGGGIEFSYPSIPHHCAFIQSVGFNVSTPKGVTKKLLTTKSDLSNVDVDFRIQAVKTRKNNGQWKFRYMLLEGDYTSYPTTIPYFEGVGSTIVNGFTVSNSDDTEMVKYTLPTPITLNKVGDVADTYDVVSGVETRNVMKVVLDGSELNKYATYDLSNEYPDIIGGYYHIGNSGFNEYLPPFINTEGIRQFDVDILPGYLQTNEEGIVVTNNGSFVKFAIKRSKLASLDTQGIRQYFSENPITLYIGGVKTPITIQHTLIPSTVETMQEPTFILPQPLRSVPNGICDRLYWDENKGHYCIEKRIGVEVFDGVNNFNLDVNNGELRNRFNIPLSNILFVSILTLYYYTNSNIFPQIVFQDEYNGKQGLALYNNGNAYFRYSSNITNAQFKQMLSDNPVNVYYALNKSEIIDLPHLNKKLTLPTQPDTLPIGYKVEHTKANPQLGLTIPYKQLNYPSRPQNIDFKMDIADYVLTWDDVKEARQYNIILNDRTIATVKEPQWNSGEEMYGYIMVEAQNELAENLSEELYIKTVPNAPAQLTVAHNPMTDYYDFEISFIKTSAIAEYYTVQYRIDNGEWVYKTIQSDEIDPNSKVLWRFSVYEIHEQIEVWATATNDIGTNDILPTAIYYMSPTPQWTYRINSKELFVRWMDDSPYDTQYKLRYQYKSDGIYRYAYFEGDKQEIGKLYEALIPLADDEEVSIALCVISEKENLYTKPIKASKELDPNIKPPKNFNYHWLARGLIEFYWEDNYDVDVEYEAIVEHRLTSGNNEWITDTRIFSATDTEGTGTVYRLSYQLEDLEEIRVKVRMRWAMNETEWSESLTTVFIPVEGNPPQWIRRTQTQEGLLVEWEAQEYVDSYHVYVMSNGEELQHLETMDNFIYVDLDYSNSIDIEIYEATRFSGGIQSDPTDKMCFRPTMDKHQLIHDVVTPDTLTYEIEVDTVQRGIKERQVIHDINTTPKVTDKQPMDVAIKSPFTLSFHPLQLDVHQSGSKYYGNTELHIKTLDVKSRDSIEVLTFERITDQYGVDFTVYTPSASKYPITLEVNRVRIVCFGDSKLRSVC